MEEKIIKGRFRNKEGVEVEGEYTMSKTLTIAAKTVEESLGLKVSRYEITQESSKEFYEWCLLDGESRLGEVEKVELINYCVIEEELVGMTSMAMTFKDGVCMVNDSPQYYQDIAFEEKFLKLLEE